MLITPISLLIMVGLQGPLELDTVKAHQKATLMNTHATCIRKIEFKLVSTEIKCRMHHTFPNFAKFKLRTLHEQGHTIRTRREKEDFENLNLNLIALTKNQFGDFMNTHTNHPLEEMKRCGNRDH